ncbi:MAG: aminotransferase class IV [Treponema sp.]|nr:aminotransferase class IV [Treponema sp.]
MDALGYYNGKWGPLDEMTIPMNDRACYFGDGVYEAAIAANGVIFTLDEHMNRLFNSAALLEIKLNHSKEELKEILYEMLSKVDEKVVLVYWQVSRGTGTRQHAFPSGPSNLMITIKPLALIDIYKKIKFITIPDTRFYLCNIKTLNLIPNVLAAERAREAGAYEAVFHRGDTVTEGSHSNIHIIKDGKLITHRADNLILGGITRSHLLQICDRLGIDTEDRGFTLSEMFDADEAIASSATSFIVSADEIDGKAVGGKSPEILKKIQDEMMREFSEETGYDR